jgi:hypothetical protein
VVTPVALLCGMNDEAARLNSLTEQIISAAITVHRALGPGLLESAYEACLGRVHEAQLISYLKLADLRVGLVLNFNVPVLIEGGIMRRVNRLPE